MYETIKNITTYYHVPAYIESNVPTNVNLGLSDPLIYTSSLIMMPTFFLLQCHYCQRSWHHHHDNSLFSNDSCSTCLVINCSFVLLCFVVVTLSVLCGIMLSIYPQCLPFYIINEVGHLTTSVDHLAEFCQNYHLAAICSQLMAKFFLQLRFIQYFDCKCMKIPDFSRIDSHFVA